MRSQVNVDRALISISCAIAMTIVALALPASADESADCTRAEALLRDGDAVAAHDIFVTIVESDDVTPTALARVARLASVARDIDVLQRVRAVGEGLEASDVRDPALDVALGNAYLGLAEAHLRNRTGGSSVALLFADAETRAAAAAAAHPAEAASLAARARYAQGDVDGALANIEAFRTAVPEAAHPELDLLEGRLRYERGAGMPVDGEGRPTDAARADLETALARLDRVWGARETLVPADRSTLALHRAWTAHRLGHVDHARSAYVAAHALDERSATLARRGIASLYARDAEAYRAALEALLAQEPGNVAVLDTLVSAEHAAGESDRAIAALERRLRVNERDPSGWTLGGRLFGALERHGDAIRYFEQALRLDPTHDAAAFGLEAVAQRLVDSDFERAVRTYDLLLSLRPDDPYARNNLGFILREYVTPHTTLDQRTGLQALKPDAPVRVGQLLERCRDVYAEAVARIPEEDDESRDLLESWNLAGIVNDYALMLHYFEDIQDAPLAEQMYLRTLRMTDDGFKDTYAPNLQRLYAFVLKGRHLGWYRLARRCKEAILKEEPAADGGIRLVPDEAKRKAAARDELGLRARIVRELGADAEADGAPWPPDAPKGDGGAGR